MTEVTNTNVYGLRESIVASGYPMVTDVKDAAHNRSRAKKLGSAKSGSGHDCMLKGIVVQMDLKTNHAVWLELMRYHFIDHVSSQSKMHRLTKMELFEACDEEVDYRILDVLQEMVDLFNKEEYVWDNQEYNKKDFFRKIVMNTPIGLELTSRMTTNYLQLKTIYNQRKGHKLKDWKVFREWCETLPMFTELIGADR